MTRAGDRLDLEDLAATLWAGRRSVFVAAILAISAILCVTLFSRMQFDVSGSLYLGEVEGKGGAHTNLPEQVDFLSGGEGEVGTEIEILKSHDLIRRAIQDSGLNVKIVPYGWKAPRYWAWRLTHRNPRVIDWPYEHLDATSASLPDGSVGAIDFTVRFLSNSSYQVLRDASVLGTGTVGQPFASPVVRMTLLPGSAGPPAPGSVYSVSVSPLDVVTDRASKALTITTPKSTAPNEPVRVVSIDFLDTCPHVAVSFVTSLMQLYLDRHQSWKSEEASAAESFVMTQVRNVKESLDAAERKLADFKTHSNVLSLDDETRGMISQLGQYEQQRVAAQLQVDAFGQMEGALKGRHVSLEQYMIGDASDPVLADLSSKLAQAQQELQGLRERFTDDAPAVHEQKAQVSAQLGMVKNYVQSRHARAQEQLESLTQMISRFDEKLKTVPGAELELAQLTRDTEVLSKMYSFLLERQQQAMVTKTSTISRNHVLDVPRIPLREESPALGTRVIAGLFIGILLGCVIVVLRRLMGDTFQTQHELQKDLDAIPVFATVPRWRAEKYIGPAGQQSVAGTFPAVIYTNPASPFAEAFRHLRTNMYCSDSNRHSSVVLLTSPCSGDGKTLCTLSLAAALVADGKRVLVIEGDMRRPTHHRLLNQSRDVGLSSIATRTDIIRTVGSPWGTFDAIFAGEVSTRPAELLSSPHFGRLVQFAKEAYDYVLIDSPPFPLVSDALIIAMHVDMVMSVVRPQNTRRAVTTEHVRRLSTSTRKHVVVINDVDPAAPGSSYYESPYYSQDNEVDLMNPRTFSRFRRLVGLGSSKGPAR